MRAILGCLDGSIGRGHKVVLLSLLSARVCTFYRIYYIYILICIYIGLYIGIWTHWASGIFLYREHALGFLICIVLSSTRQLLHIQRQCCVSYETSPTWTLLILSP